MKKNILWVALLAVFGTLGSSLQAQGVWQNAIEEFRADASLGTPQWVRFNLAQAPLAVEATEAMLNLVQSDDPAAGFLPGRIHEDRLGYTHITLQQTYQGHPVLGGVYRLHVKNGKVESVNGRYIPGLSQANVSLSETAALQKALDAVGANEYMWEIPGEETLLKSIRNDAQATFFPEGELQFVNNLSGTSSEPFRLAYKFDIYSASPLSRADIFVDAENGEVVFVNEQIHEADAVGTAHTHFSGTRSIVTDDSLADFRLREVGRGGGVMTFNMQNGTSHGAAVDFTDSDNVWDSLDIASQVGGTDAHWGAEVTYDYFQQEHNRNSFDDAGTVMLSYVNFGSSYSNAFWDGIRMTYGAGAGNNNPFSVLDVCGHEFTHGVTGNSASLIYQNESGALNESFSDIFGIAIDFFANPATANWNLGEQIGGIRNMANPNDFFDPDTYLGSYWFTGTSDNGGVHTNSGVQNYWFHLLSEGGSGTNDLGNAFNVSGIGIEKAAQIAYRNLNVYLGPMDGYFDAYVYSIQAAVDLYGPCSPEMIQTIQAWYAVGIGSPYDGVVTANYSTPDTAFCSFPAQVEFSNQSTSGIAYAWDFGDGNTSTAFAPTHTYTSVGTFDVKLVVYGCGTVADSMVFPGRVVIDPSQICNVDMPGFSASITQTGCMGNLYDSGGTGNYLDNQQSSVTIAPIGASSVSLTFASFDYAAGDYIAIYDGLDDQSPLIGFFNTSQPPPTTVVSTSPALTIIENTNGFNNRAGFVASWNCTLVSLEDEIFSGFEAFPNPFENNLKIRLPELGQENALLEVSDVFGKVLLRKSELPSAEEVQLNLSELAAGVYFLRLMAGEKSQTIRVIRQ